MTEELSPEEMFEKIKPLIEAYVTHRIVMFYEHAVECGGMSRMIPAPLFSNPTPKPDLKVIK